MKLLKEFITKNKTAFIAAAVIFFAGSVAGAVSSCRISPSEADELKEYLRPYLNFTTASGVRPGAIFSADIVNHMKFLTAALVCSVSVYLVPVFAFVLGLKGYQLGFATGFVSANFGMGGTALAVSSTLVSYCFAIPLYWLIFVLLLRFSAQRGTRAHMGTKERKREYPAYFMQLFVVFSLLCLSAGLGALITPCIVDFMN